MLEIIVENKYGEQLNFAEHTNYNVSLTGLTPPSATINSTVVATMDGSVFNNSRLNDRNMVMTIIPTNDIEESRINLYRYIKSKQYIKLYLRNGKRHVWIDGHVETVEGDLFTQTQQIQVSIICNDPYFKSVDKLTFEFASVTSSFTFPFSIDENGKVFSEIELFTEQNINNESDDETGIVIDIYARGLALEPTLYNLTTGEHFTVQHEFNVGDIVRINTRHGEKSLTLIRDGVESNILNQMVRGSKWFNLITGDNVFSYSAAHGAEQLQISITLQPIYEGV